MFHSSNLTRFIHVVDAEKCGLPRVLDSIEISCRTKHNIRILCNIIYDSVFNLKLPGDLHFVTRVEWLSNNSIFMATGGKERLLEQRIPATYLALEDIVSMMAVDQKNKGQDPVMSSEEYFNNVTSIMQSRFRMSFRDSSELNQVLDALTVTKEHAMIFHCH